VQASPNRADRADHRLAQRERLCEATVELVTEHGYEAVTEQMIRRRAGLGENDFQRHFDSKDACCIAAFERIAHAFKAEVLTASRAHQEWRHALRAGAYAAARFIRDNQRDARFNVQLLRAGSYVQSRREASLQRYVDLIDAGRAELDDPSSLSRSTAEAVLGSIVALLVQRISTGRLDDIERLVPELMYVTVRPYLGDETAREELDLPPPPERRGQSRRGGEQGERGQRRD
jgi:AcrR family transcriptional regulator